jgi:hypothetical protein
MMCEIQVTDHWYSNGAESNRISSTQFHRTNFRNVLSSRTIFPTSAETGQFSYAPASLTADGLQLSDTS